MLQNLTVASLTVDASLASWDMAPATQTTAHSFDSYAAAV